MNAAVDVLVYAFGAVVLTLVGLFIEFHSYLQYAAGEPIAALWLAGLGALFLYAGVYMLGYERVLRHVTA